MEIECPFKPGNYIIDEAYIIPSGKFGVAVVIANSVLDVELDPKGKTIVNGYGFARNVSLVELLENHQDFDIIINMGDGFCFYLEKPIINAGKVFSPNVRSVIRFTPTNSFTQIPDEEFAEIKSKLKLI